MRTITKYITSLILIFSIAFINAQSNQSENSNAEKIETLKELKEKIKTQEREYLKQEVEAISKRLDNKEITESEANRLKKEAAKNRALNIENKLAIIDNKIALLERNTDTSVDSDDDPGFSISIGGSDDDDKMVRFGKSQNKPIKYDRRTTSDLVFAIGFNNAIIDGEKLDDSPYKLGGSGFVELGWAWKTRLFNHTNAVRLKYGFSFTWNKLNIKDNNYLVNNDGNIEIEEFPSNLDKAKFRMTNLVFPVHFEFGPSKRKESDSYFRYTTRNQFKIGLGGFAGFNLQGMQKLKYKIDGKKAKDKFKDGYNVTSFVYGLSGYIAFDSTALYVKYDLSPIFKDQAIEQRNISVGLRFDMN